MKKYLLSTPIESVTSSPYYAMLDMENDTVDVYCALDDAFMDTFAWGEWMSILLNGNINPDTRRVIINW